MRETRLRVSHMQLFHTCYATRETKTYMSCVKHLRA